MSNLSVDEDYDWPYEARETADGKGQGAFATRNIEAGEIILVDSTSIFVNRGNVVKDADQTIEIYKTLEQDKKVEWDNLFSFIFGRLKPDGSRIYGDQEGAYSKVLRQFLSNDFAVPGDSGDQAALFFRAARFNHSCDPNTRYDAESVEGHWIARAARRIKEGEELLVSYIPNYYGVEERRKSTRSWDFICMCPRCVGGPDDYTASLEEARDLANGIEPDGDRVRPTFREGPRDVESYLRRRLRLLREIHKAERAADKEISQQKELVFALWDIIDFHQETAKILYDMNETHTPASLAHLSRGQEATEEALKLARRVWPEGHQCK
ncbi:hypothetical protein F5Y10DRAFT_276455 [Nemania abortiva]|nr:hypothetical protein F5Y10DRAFT_276455 [Nemania abortiva]